MRNIFILFAFAVIALTGCKQKEHENDETATYVVSNPITKDTLVYQKYVCQIRSVLHIELRALEKGYLQHIYVDEGKPVKKGQLMFQILPVIYQVETQKAQAELNFVEIEYQNTKTLADGNIVSKNELALAKAKLDKAKAELEMAKTHLSFTEIRAPFDGIVGRFNDVRIGSLMDEGDLLTTLSDNSKMWVYFNVPETEYLDFMMNNKTTQQPKVKLEMANNQLFPQEGNVETIEADFNNETGNIAFRATFQNPNRLLRHGETGNILMPVPLKNAVLIPQEATFEILDKKYVYVVDKNDVIQSREIKIGAEMPHIYVVSSGLEPTEKILTEGLRKVKNGQKIKYTTKSFETIISELQGLKAE